MKRLLLVPALLGLAGCHYLEVRQTVAAAPPASVAAAAGAVSLHLATFRQPIDKDDTWLRLTRDYPDVGQYPPRIGVVPDIAYTRLYELYIDGVPGDVAAGLCADMMAHDQYCAVQLAASPQPPAATSVTSETSTTTIMTGPPQPPIIPAP